MIALVVGSLILIAFIGTFLDMIRLLAESVQEKRDEDSRDR